MTPKTILSFEDALRAVADGKRLLVRRPVGETVCGPAVWSDWTPHRNNPNGVLLCRSYQYALAPDVVRYRRFLRRPPEHWKCGPVVWTVHERELKAVGGEKAFTAQSGLYFDCWIDTEWQEVEV